MMNEDWLGRWVYDHKLYLYGLVVGLPARRDMVDVYYPKWRGNEKKTQAARTRWLERAEVHTKRQTAKNKGTKGTPKKGI